MTSFKAIKPEFDWSILSKIGRKMYLNEQTADVFFTVDDGHGGTESVPAHKSVLAAGSAVFHRLFYEDKQIDKDVRITEVAAPALKEFLRCFYISDVEMGFENVHEVMRLSKHFEVKQCEAACIELMLRSLTLDTVCHIYSHAIKYNEAELKMTCEQFIGENIKQVLESDGFLSCDKAILEHILKRNDLSCPESLIFRACMAWVGKASNQVKVTKKLVQKYLGDLFYEVRFRSMTMDELGALLISYEHLFSAEEYGDILKLMTIVQFRPKFFNANRRKHGNQRDEENKVVCDRYRATLDSAHYIKGVEMTTFTISSPLFLNGLICSIFSHQISFAVNVVVWRKSKRRPNMLFEDDLQFINGHINFPRPVFIRAGAKHEIHLKMDIPADTYYNYNALKFQVKTASNVFVRFFKDSKLNGNLTGFISVLVFDEPRD